MVVQIFLILFIFIVVMGLTYVITNVWGLPPFLQYKPFVCHKCLAFWTLVVVYGCTWLVMGYHITAIGGWIMTILNAIAMHIDEKKRTIIVDNIEDLNEKD